MFYPFLNTEGILFLEQNSGSALFWPHWLLNPWWSWTWFLLCYPFHNRMWLWWRYMKSEKVIIFSSCISSSCWNRIATEFYLKKKEKNLKLILFQKPFPNIWRFHQTLNSERKQLKISSLTLFWCIFFLERGHGRSYLWSRKSAVGKVGSFIYIMFHKVYNIP